MKEPLSCAIATRALVRAQRGDDSSAGGGTPIPTFSSSFRIMFALSQVVSPNVGKGAENFTEQAISTSEGEAHSVCKL